MAGTPSAEIASLASSEHECAALEGEKMGGIVVGVDDSDESKAALRFALEEARLRRSSLRVVHAWKPVGGGLYPLPAGGRRKHGGGLATRAQWRQQWLDRFVHATIPDSDVETTQSAVEGDPARVLLEAATDAKLLVVGSRSEGAVARSVLLGSVSEQIAQHAPCPVVVVRRQKRPALFTHTTWQVKPGHEEEFARRWSEWVEWSHQHGFHGTARLLRDVGTPGLFVSFGPWETIAAIRDWRGQLDYQERVARLRELVEQSEPRTLEEIAQG